MFMLPGREWGLWACVAADDILCVMGIDFLDCMFRIEKEFGISHRAFDLKKFDAPRDANGDIIFCDVTCAHLLKWLELTLRETGRPAPIDCWPRLQKCIAETVAVEVRAVHRDSRLRGDMGFT
jgi:hypothetical protein